jgi:hypothetical protein
MDWRLWVYERTRQLQALEDIIGGEENIYAAGALTAAPEHKPFIILRMDADTPDLNDGDAPLIASRTLTVWVHDEPGSYVRIEGVLALLRTALIGQVPTAVACAWLGDTGDLADDTFKTITRAGTFRLIGGVS